MVNIHHFLCHFFVFYFYFIFNLNFVRFPVYFLFGFGCHSTFFNQFFIFVNFFFAKANTNEILKNISLRSFKIHLIFNDKCLCIDTIYTLHQCTCAVKIIDTKNLFHKNKSQELPDHICLLCLLYLFCSNENSKSVCNTVNFLSFSIIIIYEAIHFLYT